MRIRQAELCSVASIVSEDIGVQVSSVPQHSQQPQFGKRCAVSSAASRQPPPVSVHLVACIGSASPLHLGN